MSKQEPFTAYSDARFYPQNEVADHEVFFSFVNDADALAFRDWWGNKGGRTYSKRGTTKTARSWSDCENDQTAHGPGCR